MVLREEEGHNILVQGALGDPQGEVALGHEALGHVGVDTSTMRISMHEDYKQHTSNQH